MKFSQLSQNIILAQAGILIRKAIPDRVSVSVFSLAVLAITALGAGMPAHVAHADALAQAQAGAAADITGQLNAAGNTSGLNTQRDIRVTVAYIINIVLTLLGTVFLVIVVYAGFLWMTASGDEEKITSAKNLLKNGIIGLVLVLSAYAISQIVFYYLLRSTTSYFLAPPAGF